MLIHYYHHNDECIVVPVAVVVAVCAVIDEGMNLYVRAGTSSEHVGGKRW